MSRKKLVILGSTGSIGKNVLEIVRRLPDRFEVLGLSARGRVDVLSGQIEEFRPREVCVVAAEAASRLRGLLSERVQSDGIEVWEGEEGLERLAGHPDACVVVNGLVGAAGLKPSLAALEAGKELALANKESLVLAGKTIMALAREKGGGIRAIDSELSAIGQCLADRPESHVRKVYLTASGGPFRGLDGDTLARVTPEDALRHPVWEMGPRITVDSATLMNKGFEILEAHWLFGFPLSDIDVVVHPQSAVHAIVEFVDGFSVSLMSPPDMKLPIQYALTFPERLPSLEPKLRLTEVSPLTFEAPDLDRFPCLRLAREAGEWGQTYPAVLNAADEMAVAAFLDRRIRFVDIPRVIEACLTAHSPAPDPSVEDVLEADGWARTFCRQEMGALS